MEYRTTDIRTGLFVAFSILAATVLIFLMGGIRGAFRDAQEVRFRFANVRLLELEAAVTIGGFRVGEVVDVQRVEADNPDGTTRHEVEVTMTVDKGVRICANATAMVKQDGFLGAKYIALNPGNIPELYDRSSVLPGTTEVQLSDLMGDMKKPLAQVTRILDEVQALVSDEALEATARGIIREANLTLKRVHEVSLPKIEGVATDLGETAGKVGDRLGQSLANADRLMAEIEARAGEAKPVMEKSSRLLDELRAAVADARTVAGELKSAVAAAKADVGRISDGVTKVTGGVDRMLTDNNRNIYVLIRELRDTAATLERTARKVQANPSVLIWGDDEPVPPRARGLGLEGLRETGRAAPYGKEPGK